MAGKKMKSYDSFKLWAADQSASHKKIIPKLRKFVKSVAPKLTESVKWGNGVWIDADEKPVMFLYAAEDHLQFGFFNGKVLKDPQNLLQGKGQYVRHIKIYSVKDIDPSAFARLIKLAKSV